VRSGAATIIAHPLLTAAFWLAALAGRTKTIITNSRAAAAQIVGAVEVLDKTIACNAGLYVLVFISGLYSNGRAKLARF
jgi:hypothetical protein